MLRGIKVAPKIQIRTFCVDHARRDSSFPRLGLQAETAVKHLRTPAEAGVLKWWRGGDLNSRPSGYEPDGAGADPSDSLTQIFRWGS